MLYNEKSLIQAIAQALLNTKELAMPKDIKLEKLPLKEGYAVLGKAPPWLQALYVLEQEIRAKALVYAGSDADKELELCVRHAGVVKDVAEELLAAIPVLHGYIGLSMHREWNISGIHWETYKKLYSKK